MLTLIIRHNQLVRFFVTNHPDYRFSQLERDFPVPIQRVCVTPVKAKEIKLRFADLQTHGEWFYVSAELEKYLEGLA